MIKVGIIGSNFGVIGLLPAFNSVENCQVVAAGAGSDWQSLLDNGELDAVALAVAPDAQYQIAKVAINRGLHVFAEKPLAANLEQANELYILAQKKKITHGIDFMFPEIPEWQAVKELLASQKFGKLLHVSVSWDWLSGDIKNKKSSWKTDISRGGGILSFYFSHGFHYLEYFAGEITDIKSLLAYSPKSLNGAEVTADMLLKFKNQVTGYVHASCISDGLTRHQLIFQCEQGVIVLEGDNTIVKNFTINIYQGLNVKQIKVTKKTSSNQDERVAITKKLAERFVNACIKHKQMSPSFKDGLRVQELIELARDNQF